MKETKFKNTEIGLIPEDWEVKTIGEISEIKTGPFGSVLHSSDYVAIGTPIITVEHIGNYNVDISKGVPMVSDSDKNRLKAYILQKDDIVFSRVGSVDRSSYISENEDGWLFSGRLLRVRLLSSSNVNSKYLTYYLNSEPTRQRVIEVAVGLAMPSINTKILSGIKIVLPPLAEQRRISEVLSTADSLIKDLENVIAKKRDIKTGTMQLLLTGKKRLEGFEGDWVEKKLGEVAEITMGQSPSSEFYNAEHIGLPLIQGNADLDNRSQIVRFYTSNITKTCDENDIIMSVRAPVGAVGKATFKSCIGRGVCALKFENDFLYHLLIYNEDKWGADSKGSTFDSINSNELSNKLFYIPSDSKEQRAIAEILSDMDEEIKTLEQKVEKLRNIKTGMMQELLSGKIRLTENDAQNVRQFVENNFGQMAMAAEEPSKFTP